MIKEKPHDRFQVHEVLFLLHLITIFGQRSGSDLIYKVKGVKLVDALTGFTVTESHQHLNWLTPFGSFTSTL